MTDTKETYKYGVSLGEHFFDKICDSKCTHDKNWPEPDGYTTVRLLSGIELKYSDAAHYVGISEQGLIVHHHANPLLHEHIPMTSISRFTTVENSPEWVEKFNEWYSENHVMSFFEFDEFRRTTARAEQEEAFRKSGFGSMWNDMFGGDDGN